MTSAATSRRPRAAFTLFEIMMVIALIAVVFVGLIPLVSPSARERRLREGMENFSLQVRAQREQAMAEGRRHRLEIRSDGLFVPGQPGGPIVEVPEKTEFQIRLPGEDWQKARSQTWEFSPVGLVTPWTLRLEDGPDWIEVDFDVLTGRVVEERYVF